MVCLPISSHHFVMIAYYLTGRLVLGSPFFVQPVFRDDGTFLSRCLRSFYAPITVDYSFAQAHICRRRILHAYIAVSGPDAFSDGLSGGL